MFWRLPLLFATLCLSTYGATLDNATISEFLADNDETLTDADGDEPDWIEIENTSGVTGDLGGWFLTDDPLLLTKWEPPAAEVANGGRIIVFASEKIALQWLANSTQISNSNPALEATSLL
ncbi:MAG: hypothetical protein ABF377_00825 [Akkermansiaceae bacterium]